MDQADAILAKYPGPVTLRISRLKWLIIFTISFGVVVLVAWLLATNSPWLTGRAETALACPWIVIGSFLAFAAAILLLAPGRACLTLDADGFAWTSLFRNHRIAWRDVSEFRIEWFNAKVGNLVAYDVPGADPSQRARWLFDSYGLSNEISSGC